MTNEVTIAVPVKDGEQLVNPLTVREVFTLINDKYGHLTPSIPMHVHDPAKTFPIVNIGVYNITLVIGYEKNVLDVPLKVWVITANPENQSCENCANYKPK